jgi:hypothetical protein
MSTAKQVGAGDRLGHPLLHRAHPLFVASCGDTDHLGGNQPEPRETVRTIFVQVANEASPSYAPVHATPITSTTFSIESVHRDFSDVILEFGAGDRVRCRIGRLRGPSESGATADDRGRARRLSRTHQPSAPQS